MEAFELQAYEGPSALKKVERGEPECPQGTAIIEVQAIGINYPDLLMTQGKYQLRPELPFVPGCEIAGTINAVHGSSEFRPGDRVAGFAWTGGYAQRVQVPLTSLVKLPDHMSSQVAAAMLINYHTVLFALGRRGRLTQGETVLVLGAAGGIGSAAVQVAKGLGASKVVAGVASVNQVEAAHTLGADDVVVLEPGFAASVRAVVGGEGVNVVVDPLGDWLFAEALRALVPEGRILVIGFAAGGIPQLGVNRLLLKNVEAVGVAWGAFLETHEQILGEASHALTKMFESEVVRPMIGDTYEFDEIPNALSRLENGEVLGKAVVRVR